MRTFKRTLLAGAIALAVAVRPPPRSSPVSTSSATA